MNKVLLNNLKLLLKEKLLNNKILDELNNFKSEEKKIIYCAKLLETKNTLIILLNQTKQLGLNFPYDLQKELNNIENVDQHEIQKIIDYNIKQAKALINPKKKRKKKKRKIEDWKTKNSIRSISTPMYS